MTVYIFLGPTLSRDDAQAVLDAIYLPPAAQGDVYRAARTQPRAIGIIDGYFEHLPAIWHKEVLWAMAQGIHVFGAASMGALRAAELAAFGMEGVGEIFDAYRTGALEDDDEVAVAHAAAEDGYAALSEAMVNIRATVAQAVVAGIIGPKTGDALVRIGKRLFYAERTYPFMLKLARAEGLPPADIDRFHAWLPAGRVDQKRRDALAMLQLIAERLATGLPPKRVTYQVENTDFWEQARRLAGELQCTDGGLEPVSTEALIEELRLDPPSYARLRQRAVVRLLALNESRRAGMMVSREALQAAADQFRRERGLLSADAIQRWLAEHHLDAGRFAQLLEEEYRLTWLERLFETEIAACLPDQLRMTGEYGPLLARARAKQRLLAERGLQAPSFADAGRSEAEIIAWYFRECLGLPAIPDIDRHALSLGFPDADAFRHAVLREYLYRLETSSP
jgi:hypothetical protein